MATEVGVNGVRVEFLFEPDQNENANISKVPECPQKGTNSVLESPSGTGKTLSVPCLFTAWLMIKGTELQAQAQRSTAPGHARSAYNPGSQYLLDSNKSGGKIVTPGAESSIYQYSKNHLSTENTCTTLPSYARIQKNHSHLYASINSSIKRPALYKSRGCLQTKHCGKNLHVPGRRVQARECCFYNKVKTRKNNKVTEHDILDIEDLMNVGEESLCCPYFSTVESKNYADIISMSRNHSFDPQT
ncbi:hypothetical protein QAD02_000498 [Eretmocerus hayati]|uniref:Uncharacterized protein n=1 Tax=Eretmocerus hayati TaxID=131215 RepID=A0ACC2NDT5_9HYME|nr:hypothetical protein QAD02_000498 [Eretmocerus hayati]